MELILCPVDFSDPSRHALDYAIALAKERGARVVALHVADGELAGAIAGAADGVAVDVRRVRERIRAELSLPADPDVPVIPDVTAGVPADAIAEYAQSARPDLIVIGTRGTGGLRHLLLGSVTEDVLRTATCPVLVIPPRAAAGARIPFGRVLCATDFSAASLAALRAAAWLTRDTTAGLTVLHVIEEFDDDELFVARPYDVSGHGSEREARAHQCLERVIEAPFRGGRPPDLRCARGSASREILREASATHADLIVMGVKSRNPLGAALFGSTTDTVVRRAECPVLTAHL